MAAAPRYGTIFARGVRSGKGYAVDLYISDVVSGLGNWDSGAGASSTSDTFFTFGEPVVIYDFSIATGLTDTTAARFVGNGRPSSEVIRWANQLNTLNNRPRLNIPVRAGTRLGMLQLA